MDMDHCFSKLPEELLGCISQRSHSVEDFVRFGAVCLSWRRVTLQRSNSLKLSPPWLMLSDNEQNELRSFYSHSSHGVHHLYLPEAGGKRCWGSPNGWLITIGSDLKVHLLNPLSRSQIQLPPLPTFQDLKNTTDHAAENIRDRFIEKAVMSSSPSLSTSTNNCVVMAIYGEYSVLAFARPGDRTWTTLENCPYGFIDLIYSNGCFFALQSIGYVVKCEINGPHPTAVNLAPLPDGDFVERKYLLDLLGELHLILRDFENVGPDDSSNSRTTGFIIYKLDLSNMQWVVLQSLGDQAVFVGNNSTFSVSVSYHPEFQANCIYFTDDYSLFYEFGGGGADMGIFNYADRTIQPFYLGHDIISNFSPPLWISPSLW